MSPDELRDAAREACSRLAGLGTAEDLCHAKELVEELRNAREYDLMAQLAGGEENIAAITKFFEKG